MPYIDKFAFCEHLVKAIRRYPNSFSPGLEAAIKEAQWFPDSDIVSVVRCKSCIHATWVEKNGIYYCKRKWIMSKVRDRDYCSRGARKKEAQS